MAYVAHGAEHKGKHPLETYQDALCKLQKESDARLAIAGWNINRIARIFRQMIPEQLGPRMEQTRSHSPRVTLLSITVNGGVSIPGVISNTKDLGALKEFLDGFRNGNSKRYAFTLSGVNGKCQFFQTGSQVEGDKALDFVKDMEDTECALHHCIFFSNPDNYGHIWCILSLPWIQQSWKRQARDSWARHDGRKSDDVEGIVLKGYVSAKFILVRLAIFGIRWTSMGCFLLIRSNSRST